MHDILACMETAYLVLLIATFLAIGAAAVFSLLKLFADPR
jgi:hypothetical protein